MKNRVFLKAIVCLMCAVSSVPAMNDRVSQAVNTLAVLDEYKNDLDIRKIAYLKGLWGGGGQTKKNTNTDGMAAQTIVTTGVALCGQDKPTQDMALYTRVIFLAFSKTSFRPCTAGRGVPRCGSVPAAVGDNARRRLPRGL